MAKLLSRSKSLRLRASRRDVKDSAASEHDVSEPGPRAVEWERVWDEARRQPTSRLPDSVARAGFAMDSADVKARPKTANEALHRQRELMATGSPISVTSGLETFNFPTPLRRPYTPNSDRSVGMRSERSEIGVALGSPSQAGVMLSSSSPAGQSQTSTTFSPVQVRLLASSHEVLTPASIPNRSQTPHSSVPSTADAVDGGKPKLSRWKSLGGLFARRPSSRTAPSDEQKNQHHSPDTIIPFKLNYDNQTDLWQGEGPSTIIYAADPDLDSPRKSTPRGRWGLGRSHTAPTTRREGSRSPQPPPKGPLLDVEIPTTQMERYSVMFNAVLPQQPPSTLLARRQANSEKMKPLPGTSLKALDLPSSSRRRNTTPEPSPSYRLLIFPPESSKKHTKQPQPSTLHRPRPLTRSNTAPGALSPGLPSQSAAEATANPLSPMSETDELLEDERQALTSTPSEPSTPTTPDGSSVPLHNPFAHDRGSAAWHEDKNEPSWEMITIGKLAEPGDRVSTAQVRVEGADEPVEEWLHRGVELQVARSVSVTKARRRLIGARLAPGKGERLVERKPLTPTFVEGVDLPGSNRQSVRGVVEGFD